MKKILLLIIAVTFITVGCQNQATPPQGEKPPVVEEPASPGEDVESPVESGEGLLFELNAILGQEGSGAAEIGLFIREHAANASPSEMERMIETLLLYQAPVADAINQKTYTGQYMKALNETMGGVLTPDKIKDIENEEVRKDFQQLVDAHMTVVRYEETPVAEIDWRALSAYESAVTEDFSRLIFLWDKMQNSGYGRQDIAFEEIIQDLVETEEMIQSNDVSFLTWQLDRLYDRQRYALLVGPEGTYMDTFINKSSDLYQTLMKGAADYPDTGFAQLVQTLEEANTTDYETLNNIMLNDTVFGVKGKVKIVKDRLDGGDTMGELYYVHLPKEAEKEKAVNDLINQVAASMELTDETTLNNYFHYGNDHYLSLAIFASYIGENGEYTFREEMVTINLDTMERETLRYMLEREGGNVSITEMFATAPYDIDNFIIEGLGLRLMWTVEGQDQVADGRIWFYELGPYMSLYKLYR